MSIGTESSYEQNLQKKNKISIEMIYFKKYFQSQNFPEKPIFFKSIFI